LQTPITHRAAALSAFGLLLGSCSLFACGSPDSPEDAPKNATDASNEGEADPVPVECEKKDRAPTELADAEALTALTNWSSHPVLRNTEYRQASSTETVPHDNSPSLLRNENRDMNNFICASGDAQYESGIIPVTLKLEACEDDYVKGLVMAREEGPGSLARLWLTRGLTQTPGLLRIYVDDEREPVVEVSIDAMMDGSAGEIFAAPFGAESESHVAWYYPVVFSSRLIMTADELSPGELFYYQTDVVLDESPRHRERACDRLPERDAAIALLDSKHAGPATGAGVIMEDTAFMLTAGETREVASIEGPATIDTVRLGIAAGDAAALDGLWLTVHWDDAATDAPAIDVPLMELFASALDTPSHNSLALGAAKDEEGNITLRFSLPMPFSTSAHWTLENRGETTADVTLGLVGAQAVPDEPWGRLHTQRHETIAPAEGLHPLLHQTGPGRFLGTCFLLEGHAADDLVGFSGPFNFLEGDEVGTLDGRLFKGTGTEDYLNGSFYFQEGPFGTAFAQSWGVSTDPDSSPASGHVSACRWHVLADAVHFSEQIDLDLEIGPNRPDLLERYRTVAYFYQ
jgi:hypothetical protein